MKTKLAPVIMLFFLVLAATPASAFYDPGTQKWINRDPIAEKGGVNLYDFARNAPTDFFDPWGLIGPVDSGSWPPGNAEGGGGVFIWIDTQVSPGPPGTRCVYFCVVYGLGPSNDPDPGKLKFCVGVAKARLRAAAAANNQAAFDDACQLLHDCHSKHE